MAFINLRLMPCMKSISPIALVLIDQNGANGGVDVGDGADSYKSHLIF